MSFQLKIKSFRLYYGDDTTFDGFHINQWLGAPIENIQAVLLKYHDGKPEVFARRDWYGMLVNQHGLRFECQNNANREFADRCDPKGVKMGATIKSDKYSKIIKQAQEDRDKI